MITRQKVLEIQSYCADNNVTVKDRILELGIPEWEFYRSRRKYIKEDEENGSFVRLRDGSVISNPKDGPAPHPPKNGANQSYLTVEMRTASGSEFRIQGMMSPEHLREVMMTGGGHV